jgi:hypothetical protein
MDALLQKAVLPATIGIAIAVVAVDFTSWLMSALVELILMGALVALIWTVQRRAR